MATNPIDRRAIPTGARIDRWTASDGWELRRFYWAPDGKQRGSILFQSGRGDIFEKYLESFAEWHARGWGITAYDWRGQGGSGRLTPAGDCGHIADFATYIDDLRQFAGEWMDVTPGPHVVMGHSMGGHLVLRALVEGVIRPDAAVLVAPMLGIKGPFGATLGERFARILGGVGNSGRPAWKTNERPFTKNSRESMLTHDVARYEDELWWHAQNPELKTGPASWRWVIEAFRSTRELRANPGLKTMNVPTLALIAEADKLVDAKTAVATVSKLPDARILRFGNESAHEILREGDKVRNRAMGEIDLFLEARAQQA